MRPLLTGLLFAITCTCFGRQSGSWVSPHGDDRYPGTRTKPFRTLTRALEAIHALKGLQTDASIHLLPGGYRIAEPLDFGAGELPLNCALTLDAPSGGAIISGGRQVTGWKREPGSGVWRAHIEQAAPFHQLFVNGRPAVLARSPNQGFFRVAGFPDGGREVNYQTRSRRLQYSPEEVDAKWDLRGAEAIVYHFWVDAHLRIDSAIRNTLYFHHPAGHVFTDDFSGDGARYILRDFRGALDRPGEWFFDKKASTLYYIPRPGEDMLTADIEMPVAPALISIKGIGDRQRLIFKNLQFEYSRFVLPADDANDYQGANTIPGAIRLQDARHCLFEHCTVRNAGGFAFEVSGGCSSDSFTGNRILGPAAGGFRIDGAKYDADTSLQTHDIVVSDNEISGYGVEFADATGILLMNAWRNEISHNHIHDGYYTGISVGWEWGLQRSTSVQNTVSFNHIHDIGKGLLSDMGGIYTLGVSPGTALRNNLIHDVNANRYGGWGIYSDEGSSGILIENNVVYNTMFAPYNINTAKEVTVRNNIFAFGKKAQISRNIMERYKSVFFGRNIVYWTQGPLFEGKWQDRNGNSSFEADHNIYFNPTLTRNSLRFNGLTEAEWHASGKDLHSVFADPEFINAKHFDFRLLPGSPALKMGFTPIDLTRVGPRKLP